MLFYQTLSCIIYGIIKKVNSKFKISAPTWNKKFQLPGGSYFVSSIQYYFEYILKKHRESTDNPSVFSRVVATNKGLGGWGRF